MVLVALRVVIGWHFFKEGSNKIQTGNFSSAAFLRAAKGPFAENFRSMSHDLYGTERLDKKKVMIRAAGYRDMAGREFGLDDQGKAEAQKLLGRYQARINYYFDEIEPELDDYFKSVAAFEKDRRNAHYRGVAHYEDRLAEKDKELLGKLNGWTKELATYEADFIDDLNKLGRSKGGDGRIHQINPNQGWVDIAATWVTFGAGALLILGLFTRLAALAAAGFLLQVMLTQWPFAHGAEPVYYQSVEFVSLLFLAAIGAGKFAGLDYILWNLFSQCCGRGASNNEV